MGVSIFDSTYTSVRGKERKSARRVKIGVWRCTSYPKPEITLDNLILLTGEKAIYNRPKVLYRLEQMGAIRISRLKPNQYATFYNFLKSL